MKWVSHILIGSAIAAAADPIYVPAAAAGSVAPDWLEGVLRVKHRGPTHYASYWLGAAVLLGAVYGPITGHVFWYALGGLLHVFCDALTVSGVPWLPTSDRRFHLLGGRLVTGSITEYMITALFVGFCLLVASASADDGYSPFFIRWGKLYESGLLDASEWYKRRLSFF